MTTTPEREHELQVLLRQRAEQVDVPGDFAPLAIARRRRTVRGRAVLGAVVAVGAVAVATPALWSSQGPGPSPVPAITTPTSTSVTSSVPTQSPTTTPPTTTPPTQSPTGTSGSPSTDRPVTPPAAVPTVSSDARPKSSVALAFGPADGSPEAAYAVGGTFYDGGTERALPVSSGIQYLARLANGGLLVHAPANTRAQPTFVVDASGATVLRLGDVQDIRANADGSRFTTIDAAGTIRLRDPMGRVLATLRTGDTNASVRGFFADRVYYTVLADGSGRGTTRSWDPASGDTRDVTAGRFQAVHEASGLAILLPDQAYDPDHTCYGMYDIAAGRVRWWSCGAFAPTAFGAGGTIVVGPEVADGPGTTRFRTASTRDGSVIGRVALTGGAWSPSWIGHDAKGLTFTLLNRESPTRQVLAACSLPNYGCSIDSAPATVTAAQRDSFMWPIVLAAN